MSELVFPPEVLPNKEVPDDPTEYQRYLEVEYEKSRARDRLAAEWHREEEARQAALMEAYADESTPPPPGGYVHRNDNKKRRLTVEEKLDAASFALHEAMRPLTPLQKIRLLSRELAEERRLHRLYLDSKRRPKE